MGIGGVIDTDLNRILLRENGARLWEDKWAGSSDSGSSSEGSGSSPESSGSDSEDDGEWHGAF